MSEFHDDYPSYEHMAHHSEEEGKKGKIILTISPNDVSKVNALHFEIHENGRAYLSVDSQDRQPISFDGYLEINEKAKK